MFNYKKYKIERYATDSSGNLLYYPYGLFGNAYVVSTHQEKLLIEDGRKKSNIVFFAIGLPIASLFYFVLGHAYAVLFIIVLLLIDLWHNKVLLNSKKKISYSESIRFSPLIKRQKVLWLLFICNLYFLFHGLAILLGGGDFRTIITGSSVVIFSVLLLSLSVRANIYIRRILKT